MRGREPTHAVPSPIASMLLTGCLLSAVTAGCTMAEPEPRMFPEDAAVGRRHADRAGADRTTCTTPRSSRDAASCSCRGERTGPTLTAADRIVTASLASAATMTTSSMTRGELAKPIRARPCRFRGDASTTTPGRGVERVQNSGCAERVDAIAAERDGVARTGAAIRL